MRTLLIMIGALVLAACAAPREPQSTDKRAEQMLNDRQAEQAAYCRRVGTQRRDPECPPPERAARGGVLPATLPETPAVPELPRL